MDQMFHERAKHIDVRYHFIRGVIAQGDVKICKISTHNNPADMLTKPVPGAKSELWLKLSWYYSMSSSDVWRR